MMVLSQKEAKIVFLFARRSVVRNILSEKVPYVTNCNLQFYLYIVQIDSVLQTLSKVTIKL